MYTQIVVQFCVFFILLLCKFRIEFCVYSLFFKLCCINYYDILLRDTIADPRTVLTETDSIITYFFINAEVSHMLDQ